jgi:hypothetical protein
LVIEMPELSREDLEIIGASLRDTRDKFRSYEHSSTEDTMIDAAYAGKVQDLLERLGLDEDPPIMLVQ